MCVCVIGRYNLKDTKMDRSVDNDLRCIFLYVIANRNDVNPTSEVTHM